MKSEKEIVDFLLEKDLRLKFLEDQVCDLEGDAKHEAIAFLGDFELVDWDERKDRRECIEIAVVHFKDYGFYLKEVAIGECHYSDVMIDGWPNEINYFTVDPVQTVTYDNEKAII
ncbi:hypothetical protein UFOVP699_51 [uncultured Caudovirales phage]|uniref:Uncharacterized protein n=1 Tax=uncultured Caudovirales phage TaxID=2100421 RepID=A0A6J5NPR2_9CAUD|nr:hypothetical protein UFOVP699_51 [uncultured Caudovirales phage]